METELKFQVPAAASAAVQRAVATASAVRTPLRAVYFDTEDRRLAAAGFALRLRREGEGWVQTLKGRGDGLARRLEDEVPLGRGRGEPRLDIARHAGTPAGTALATLLADGAALHALYRTAIERAHRRVRHAGAVIEIAHDRGRIEAGAEKVPVDEIEFELVKGPPQALPALAARWAERHGLWWDVRTKSERGFRLATGALQVPAVRAQAAVLPAGEGVFEVWQSTLAATLAQALPNAAEIAAGTDTPEHLHQLRVALRRLRTALLLMAPWGGDEAAALALEREWAACFGELGAARDTDVIEARFAPLLAAAGAPAVALAREGQALPPGDVVRGAAFTRAALGTLALALAAPPAASAPRRHAADALLQGAWRKAWADARAFERAEAEGRHRARKRIKRLRYAFEFVAPLYGEKAGRRFQKALGRALEALGDLNDMQVASARYREAARSDPGAWFAVGWLRARHEAALAGALESLAKLKAAPKPWRG